MKKGYADQPTEESQTILTAQNTLQSTVKINPGLDRGSGFYIASDTILTNWHVIANAGSEVKFKLSNGTECTAKVGYREEKLDLAILKTECAGIALPLATKDPVTGTSVMALGNPAGLDFFFSKGIISGDWNGFLLFDAFIYNGSSGGPLVSLHNEVVGVVKAKAKEHQGIGAAIPVEDVHRFLWRANQ